MRPFESPATISRLLLWFAIAKAVNVGTSSTPAGSWSCLCVWTVTFHCGPRYCETFSSVEFDLAAFSSFDVRRCRTVILCTRIAPAASPVAIRCSSWVGEVTMWVSGCSWPVLKLNTSSPLGPNKCTFPSAWEAAKRHVGICDWGVEAEEVDVAEGRGLRRRSQSTWTTGSTKGRTAFVTKKSSAAAMGSLSPWLATSESKGKRSVRAWAWADDRRPLPLAAPPKKVSNCFDLGAQTLQISSTYTSPLRRFTNLLKKTPALQLLEETHPFLTQLQEWL